MQFTNLNLTFLLWKPSKSCTVAEEQHYVAFLQKLCVPLFLFNLAQCDCLRLKDHMLYCIVQNFCSKFFCYFCNYRIITKIIFMKIFVWKSLPPNFGEFSWNTLSEVLYSAIIVTAFTFAASRSQWWWLGLWVVTSVEHWVSSNTCSYQQANNIVPISNILYNKPCFGYF